MTNQMKVAIFEIGNFYDVPNITRVFFTKECAIKNIPARFKRVDVLAIDGLYYQNDTDEKWLTIKTYKVER